MAIVTEQYVEEDWSEMRTLPAPLLRPAAEAFGMVIEALSGDSDAAIVGAIGAATGVSMSGGEWRETLHDFLAPNDLLYRTVAKLRRPGLLVDLCEELSQEIGRTLSEEELLFWLALGSAARRDGRPLVRPVLHGFIRGVGGAVVTFPEGQTAPQLWLSSEDSRAIDQGDHSHCPLSVKTCTTCGQHFFTHELAGFDFTGDAPGGGELVEGNTLWRPLPRKDGGVRVTLFDRLVAADEGDQHDRAGTVYLCRYCGTVHAVGAERCGGCGRPGPIVPLQVVQQNPKRLHSLTSCLGCGARGGDRPGTYREPARPVRAVTVSDVHVLGQNMLLHGREERLLIFADNRQDAAFQAGWMRDHARRFRVRSLMLERLVQGAVSVGDLVAWLDDRLERDRPLSESLLPEVWRMYRPDSEPVRHADERRLFLRILVLREITSGARQRIGLEPWGRLRVDYAGLIPTLPFAQKWAAAAGISPETLLDGIANLIDSERRKMVVYDSRGQIFSKYWNEGEPELVRGYLPKFDGVPQGLKLFREAGDDQNRIRQWWSPRGATVARQVAQHWGIARDQVQVFLEELWQLLRRDTGLLVEVQLRGGGRNGRVLPNTQGSCQFDADKFLLMPQQAIWECNVCRRLHTRPTPNMACMGFHCDGTLVSKPDDPDNYDVSLVTRQVGADLRMLKPREHSAQVPVEEREQLERMFKDPNNNQVNTLVCTPTLELGVDIGGLDSVMMRNVPPLAANYWQRAGRAGRRHRMAVNLTYARTAPHDRAHFAEPMRLLGGAVTPPRFNLRNPELVRKHAHAAILTALFQLAREGSTLPAEDRAILAATLNACFPTFVRDYLFEANGDLRTEPFDAGQLASILQPRRGHLLDALRNALQVTWPPTESESVSDEFLRGVIMAMPQSLMSVVTRLWRRLQWALRQKAVLAQIEGRRGTLTDEEKAIRQRCDRLIARYKGETRRDRRDTEGLDDTNTYAVLAAEGFLPGYGLDRGSVLGAALMPRGLPGPAEYLLPRPKTMAIREYVPGNLIYCNGNKFVPRTFHLEPEEQPVSVYVNLANEAVAAAEPGGSTGGETARLLRVVPVCDVDLPHQLHIQDEEDHRFQLPVVVFGHELGRHSGGMAWQWGNSDLQFRRAVHLRLVNVGVRSLVYSDEPRLGYPVCLVTGQSRSPLASQAELDDFREDRRERYGREPEHVGFYADVVADALTLPDCENVSVAYSVAEALRLAAAEVLEMEMEDLQVLCIPHLDRQTVDSVLFDPMPGGSGLLEQMTARWGEIIAQAQALLAGCASACQTACIDCMLHFRNAHYHRHLNRHTALHFLEQAGDALAPKHPIPPVLPADAQAVHEQPTNPPEMDLRAMLIRAGFAEPEAQRSIAIGPPWGRSIPDFFYPDPTERTDGVCIFLDGLSGRIHGNPETRDRDEQIRERLREMGYEVIAIPASALTDRDRMANYFFRLARCLMDRTAAEAIRTNPAWFS